LSFQNQGSNSCFAFPTILKTRLVKKLNKTTRCSSSTVIIASIAEAMIASRRAAVRARVPVVFDSPLVDGANGLRTRAFYRSLAFCSRSSLAITRHHPIAQHFVGQFDRVGIDERAAALGRRSIKDEAERRARVGRP